MNVGDEFISNDGKGPLRARVVRIWDRYAEMLSWNAKTGGTQWEFHLPVAFFSSIACGWKPARAAQEETE